LRATQPTAQREKPRENRRKKPGRLVRRLRRSRLGLRQSSAALIGAGAPESGRGLPQSKAACGGKRPRIFRGQRAPHPPGCSSVKPKTPTVFAGILVALACALAGCQSSPSDPSYTKVYQATDADTPPKSRTARTPPVYPLAMKEKGISGEVRLQFVITYLGTVRDVKVISSTRNEFEAPAVEAVRQWRFSPGVKGGRPVNCLMQMPIRFSLTDDEPAGP
jgi:TonB family protein